MVIFHCYVSSPEGKSRENPMSFFLKKLAGPMKNIHSYGPKYHPLPVISTNSKIENPIYRMFLIPLKSPVISRFFLAKKLPWHPHIFRWLRPRWSLTPCGRCLRLQRHVVSHAGLAETGLGGGRAQAAHETLGSIPKNSPLLSPCLWWYLVAHPS